MKTMLLTGVLALAALQHPIAAGPNDALATSSPKPNILLIIADDLNDWITPMGGASPGPHPASGPAGGSRRDFSECPLPGPDLQSIADGDVQRPAAHHHRRVP
jgi:hypothetical protein